MPRARTRAGPIKRAGRPYRGACRATAASTDGPQPLKGAGRPTLGGPGTRGSGEAKGRPGTVTGGRGVTLRPPTFCVFRAEAQEGAPTLGPSEGVITAAGRATGPSGGRRITASPVSGWRGGAGRTSGGSRTPLS